jgi:integrase
MTAEKRRQYGSGSISQRSKDGRWVGAIMAGWTAKGTRRRITVTGKTEAEVKRKIEAKRQDIARNGIPAEGTPSRTTVKMWADQWLKITERQVRPKTWATNSSTVNTWINPHIGHRRLDQLTPGDFRTVQDAIRAEGLAHNTALRAMTILKQLLLAAVQEGHQVTPRVTGYKLPAPQRSRRTDMSLEHARAILTTADGLPDASRWYTAFHLGIRQGETLGLTWDRVNLNTGTVDISWQLQALPYNSGRSGTLRVPDGYEFRRLEGALCLVRPKTVKSERLLPLSAVMVDRLTTWQRIAPPSPHNLVWSRNGRPIAANDDRAAWHALQQLADVRHPDDRPYYLHECRHTAATIMRAAGVPVEVIEEVLGHAAILTTLGYAHTNQELRQSGVDKLAAALEGVQR